MSRIDGARPALARVVSFTGARPMDAERLVPDEVAVNVTYATVPFAVMMTTPHDLEDFAVGFSLSEGIIGAADEVRAVRVGVEDDGIRLHVDLEPSRLRAYLARHRARQRALTGRTGCGACGVADLADLPRARRRTGTAPPIAADAIRRALSGLEAGQALNRLTGATHAAAFADADGSVRWVREDVGRHNALDKLIGAVMRGGGTPENGFVVVTSRCSFEMVEKVAAFGGHTLVAISLPTTLALERARLLDIGLACLVRRDTMTVFHGAERIGALNEGGAELPDRRQGDLLPERCEATAHREGD